jgi:membrane protein DedA with SNARE-associated domain
MWWLYLIVFVAAFMLDIVPVPSPPAWTVMVFLQVRYDLDIWYVCLFGVTGSVIGRYFMSLYFKKISDKFISIRKNHDLEFLGSKLSSNRPRGWLFVFIYTLVPLPSTPLFNVMGIARVSPLIVLPPFFAGKFISDGFMLYAGNIVAQDLPALLKGVLTWQSLLALFLSLFILAMILFIDWWTLIVSKKLRLNFHVWKNKKEEDEGKDPIL